MKIGQAITLAGFQFHTVKTVHRVVNLPGPDDGDPVHDGFIVMHLARNLAANISFALDGPIYALCGDYIRIATQTRAQTSLRVD